jgi:hypothetical protein
LECFFSLLCYQFCGFPGFFTPRFDLCRLFVACFLGSASGIERRRRERRSSRGRPGRFPRRARTRTNERGTNTQGSLMLLCL